MPRNLTNFPSVDLIITFHRDDQFLAEAIQSAISSKNVKLRIIAVDNRRSNSPQPRILENPSITVVSSEEEGYARTLNAALPHLESEFVAFLNSDDLHSPDRLITQIEALEKFHGDISICNIQKFSDDNLIRKRLGDLKVEKFHPELMLLGFFYTNATWVIRRSCLPQNFTWPTSVDHTYADWVLFKDTFIDQRSKIVFINSKMYLQRVHSEQISRAKGSSLDSAFIPHWLEMSAKVGLSETNQKFILYFIVPWKIPPVGITNAISFMFTTFSLYIEMKKLVRNELGKTEFTVYNKDLRNLLLRRSVISLMGQSVRRILGFT